MKLNDYQTQAAKTAIYPEYRSLDYLIPALAAEAGEIAGKWAKHLRDDDQYAPTVALNRALATEAGDVLWVLAMLCSELGWTLSDVASANLKKLADRKQRGKLSGSGDHR